MVLEFLEISVGFSLGFLSFFADDPSHVRSVLALLLTTRARFDFGRLFQIDQLVRLDALNARKLCERPVPLRVLHQFRGLLFKSFRSSADVVWLTGSAGFCCFPCCIHGLQFGVGLHEFWGVVVITSLFWPSRSLESRRLLQSGVAPL